MTKRKLLQRTKDFAVRVARTVQALPRGDTASILGKRLLRSVTSVGANYRAACRAKSGADFLNKLRIVEEECDESLYCRELLVDSGLMLLRRLQALMREGDELLAITVSAIKTRRAARSA